MDNDFDCNSSKIFFIVISIEYENILQQYLIGNGIKFNINWYIFSRIKKTDWNLQNKENLSLSFIQKINIILNNLSKIQIKRVKIFTYFIKKVIR